MAHMKRESVPIACQAGARRKSKRLGVARWLYAIVLAAHLFTAAQAEVVRI